MQHQGMWDEEKERDARSQYDQGRDVTLTEAGSQLPCVRRRQEGLGFIYIYIYILHTHNAHQDEC